MSQCTPLKATSEEIQRNRAKDIAEEQKRHQALAQAVREAHQARAILKILPATSARYQRPINHFGLNRLTPSTGLWDLFQNTRITEPRRPSKLVPLRGAVPSSWIGEVMKCRPLL